MILNASLEKGGKELDGAAAQVKTGSDQSNLTTSLSKGRAIVSPTFPARVEALRPPDAILDDDVYIARDSPAALVSRSPQHSLSAWPGDEAQRIEGKLELRAAANES